MKCARSRSLTAALVVSISTILSSPADAAPFCTGRFRFCDNCVRQITVQTKKNTACQIPYFIATGAIFSQKVTKRGNGIYGTKNSTSGAYQPKPNYVGKDYFEVEIHYERSGSKFTTTLQADVTVTE